MGITFSALSIPSPILFAFISAIASMIPFMVSIVYILLGAAVFVIYGATKTIIILVIGVALNIFTDNFMQPKIINKQVYIQPISQKERATKLAIKSCIENNWRLSVQVHKYIGIE